MDATLLAVLLLVYPAVLLLANVYSWIKRKGFQSIKALGALISLALFAAGAIYGFAVQCLVPTQDFILVFILFAVGFAFVYPVCEFVSKKDMTPLGFIFRFPTVMIISYFFPVIALLLILVMTSYLLKKIFHIRALLAIASKCLSLKTS